MNALTGQTAADLTNPERRPLEPLFAPIKRWRLTLACLVVAAGAAAAVAMKYGQKLWPVEATVVHTPLPIGEAGRGDYTPTSPQTMISLVKAPHRLERVAADLKLPISARVLEQSLKVSQQPNVDAVRLSLVWPDPDVGRAIIDRLIELYVLDMADLRRRKIEESIDLLQGEQAGHVRRAAAARATSAALPGGANGSHLTSEAQRLAAAATSVGAELNVTRERLATIDREVTRFRAIEKSDVPPGDDAAYRERKQILLTAIRERQERLAEIDAETEGKKKELSLQEKLLRAGTVSQIDYDKITGDLRLLAVRRKNAAEATESAQKELTELPRKYARISLAALAAENEMLELKAGALERSLADNRREQSRVNGLIGTAQEVAKGVEQADADCRTVAARIANLERLRTSSVTEFTAPHPAAAAAEPSGSNRKSLAVLTFSTLMSVYLLGVIGQAWYTRLRPQASLIYGLPLLAVADDSAPGGARSALEARRLALPLRDPVRTSGGLILIAPAEESVGCDDVVRHLARYLALAGESVLILDARVHQPRRLAARAADASGTTSLTTRVPCLSRYLRHQPDEPPHVQESETGVWYLPAGEPFPDPDLLASEAMRRLLLQLSGQYDRVLILCPPLETSVGAEILAGYADGAIVVVRRGVPESAAVSRAVVAIRAAGVPWAGALVLSRDPNDGLPFANEELPSGGRSAEELADEEEDVPGVTWSQPSGFERETPRPFETATLEPARSPAHPTR